MATRKCPICRVMKLRRQEVHTCGAPDCVMQWRSMNSAQRARAIDEAASPLYYTSQELEDAVKIKELTGHTPPIMPTSTTERDEEFLRKLFGPDAPGIPKKEDKNPEDK